MRRAVDSVRAVWRVALLALTLVDAPAVGAQGAARATDSMRADAVRADAVRADSVLDARTSVVAAELRCAVCQGISIQESPSALAREMRELVKDQLRAGSTPAEVKAYFVSKYGEWILLSPTTNGLNVLLYVLPALLLFGGIIFLAVTVRRWAAVVTPDDHSPADDAR